MALADLLSGGFSLAAVMNLLIVTSLCEKNAN